MFSLQTEFRVTRHVPSFPLSPTVCLTPRLYLSSIFFLKEREKKKDGLYLDSALLTEVVIQGFNQRNRRRHITVHNFFLGGNISVVGCWFLPLQYYHVILSFSFFFFPLFCVRFVLLFETTVQLKNRVILFKIFFVCITTEWVCTEGIVILLIWNRVDCQHSEKKIQNTQEIKRTLFNWTKFALLRPIKKRQISSN